MMCSLSWKCMVSIGWIYVIQEPGDRDGGWWLRTKSTLTTAGTADVFINPAINVPPGTLLILIHLHRAYIEMWTTWRVSWQRGGWRCRIGYVKAVRPSYQIVTLVSCLRWYLENSYVIKGRPRTDGWHSDSICGTRVLNGLQCGAAHVWMVSTLMSNKDY